MKKPIVVLQDCTNGDLRKTLRYAEKINDFSLHRCLDRLAEADINCKSKTKIYPDFAPYSFSFARMRNKECITNGGIIFHGIKGEYGAGAPTFSVSISNSPGWSIHT